MKTLYEEIKEAGIQQDNHASDLYILASVEVKRILKRRDWKPWPSTFVSEIDKKIYYDVPFAYDPFWISKKEGL